MVHVSVLNQPGSDFRNCKAFVSDSYYYYQRLTFYLIMVILDCNPLFYSSYAIDYFEHQQIIFCLHGCTSKRQNDEETVVQ